ncbi:G-protein alpha subunit-domain-containing protein [Mycena galericulata]|nr:G-protein alpha subunit-domain-containing protein [Mycena galericulata]
MTLRARLIPLLQIEDVLVQRLSVPGMGNISGPAAASTSHAPIQTPRLAAKEVAVNSTVAWKSAFIRDGTGRESFDTQNAVDWDDPADRVYTKHLHYIHSGTRLWAHPTVHAILERQGVRLQELPGFFLDELEIVTAPRYVPTNDHILRARLKTLGVSEHRMRLSDPYGGISREFRIFHVGGQRSMKWVPYFDDVDAIIFLASISAFDQVLTEDSRVNRLADSLEVWKAIVSNKLLEKANMILFLNKVDILQAKLASGIRLADFLPSYGRRPNDFDSASRYVKHQFSSILKQSSLIPRIFYCHLTNVIDNKSTTYVLAGIRDHLMRFNLKESHLIM